MHGVSLLKQLQEFISLLTLLLDCCINLLWTAHPIRKGRGARRLPQTLGHLALHEFPLYQQRSD
jgi:hypothetical protein